MSNNENNISNIEQILINRENSLNEAESRVDSLLLKHIEHKRAFLSTAMSISMAAIVGLFLLIHYSENQCLQSLILITIGTFALFLCFTAIYMILLLDNESQNLIDHKNFIKNSKEKFINAVINQEIKDFNSFEKFRKKQFINEKKLRKTNAIDSSKWFFIVGMIFGFSTILSFATIIYTFLTKIYVK